MIDVSVVIATYNVAAYIEQAIASALRQEGVNIEIILVDDGSTDATWSILERQTDPRIKTFRLSQNSGPSVARNKGFLEATGKWIAILDGDDIYLPGRLARCVALAEATGVQAVVDNLLMYYESGAPEKFMFDAKRFTQLHQLTLERLIRGTLSRFGGYPLGYVKPLFLAEFLRSHPLEYDPKIRIGEDYLLLAHALAFGAKCVVDPHAGYRYTVRKGSISHKLDTASVDQMLATDQLFLARHQLTPAERKAQRMRTYLLKENRAYVLLLLALKRRSFLGVVQALAACPTALRHLHQPLALRLRKMLGLPTRT